MKLPKNFAKAGIIGLTMFVLYKIINTGSAIKDLQVSISKINYTFSAAGLILTLMLSVTNTRKEDILFNSIAADLLLNDNVLGSVNSDLQVIIGSEKSVLLPVSINLFYLPVVKTIQDIVTGKNKGLAQFNLKGSAVLEDITFPLNVKYSLV